jgi:hypothetical protein
MNPRKKYVSVLLALLLAVAPGAFAGVASNSVAVPMNFSVPESISLSLSTNSVTLTSAAQSADIILTAGWQIQGGHTSATIYSFFSQQPVAGGISIQSSQFSTAYNHGAQVVCNQPAFAGVSFGTPGQNCGTFSFPNIGTTLNSSQAVTLTLAAAPSTFSGIVGNYTGGVLNVVFQIV